MKLKTEKQQRKINETKNYYFEKINKTDNALASSSKQKCKKYHNRTHTGRRLREYYKQIHEHNFDKLEEMDHFLKTHKLSKLNKNN